MYVLATNRWFVAYTTTAGKPETILQVRDALGNCHALNNTKWSTMNQARDAALYHGLLRKEP